MNSDNRYKLYRSRNRVILGICRGLAEYMGLPTGLVRLVAFMSLFVWGPFAVIFYFIAGLMIEKEPKNVVLDRYDRDYYRRVSFQPAFAVDKVGNDLGKIENRIRDIERAVTSRQYQLKQQFKELEDL